MWCTKDIVIRRILTSNMPLLVSNDKTNILIDTGRLKGQMSIVNKLKSLLNTEPIDLILLTHTHHDHIENLEVIQNLYPSQVLVHEEEAHQIKAKNVITFKDYFDLTPFGMNGFAIHTPGHSKGSISIILNHEIAITGDLIGDFHTKPFATSSKKVNQESINSLSRLIDLKCQLYIPCFKTEVYSLEVLSELKNRFR